MKKRSLILIPIVALTLLWNGCNKDETAVTHPLPGNEFLTTVELVATNAADASDVQTGKWVQLDPNGSTPPDTSHAVLNLKKNAVYNVEIRFLDETKTPADDITSEISDRANYHLVCFDISTGLNLTIQRTDHDANNPPLEVGLLDKFTTGNISNGTLEVTLHHQPNVKNGDCAPGSIDADVTYTINIL